jgi:hypothetical protein
MKLKLGTNDTFDCPEGTYKAILTRIGEPKKRINKPCAKQVRLTYSVAVEGGKQYLVARTFCADLSYGGELYNFLETWLDGNFEPLTDENHELDLALLVGQFADLIVTHYDDGNHGKPFVKIAGIFPPGKLIEE